MSKVSRPAIAERHTLSETVYFFLLLLFSSVWRTLRRFGD